MTKPLSGLSVLDFSTLLPGPYASMMLADMGADVLRIESPSRIDLLRIMPPMDGKYSASHSYLNRGKRSIGLNLKHKQAVEIVKKLVKKYDILLEQFRPDVMQRLGLGYDALKAVNPRLIYCSITGYGQTGPYKNRAGHDINYLALSGVISYSGSKTFGPPNLGFQLGDIAGGSHHAVMGILAAVIEREKTGLGQQIDISMSDALFSINAMSMAGYLAAGAEPEPESGLLNGGAFYGFYETADHRYLAVGSLEPQFLKRLCDTLNKKELYSTGLSQRAEDQAVFRQALKDSFLSHTFQEWCHIFSEVDACVEPVLSLSEAVDHPQFISREMTVDVPRFEDESAVQCQASPPISFSGQRPQPKFTGCTVGHHTYDVLTKELGMSKDDVEILNKNGIFR